MGSTTTRRLKNMNMRVISVFAVFTVCVLCSAQTEIPEQFATESDGHIETIQDNTEETRTPRSLAVNRDLMRAKEILAKVGHHCTASKNNLAAAKAQIAKHTNADHKALNVAKKICKKEKEMARRSAEKKKKHEARGATFKFDTGKPCKGGKGDFRMKLKQDQSVVVGKIPANMKDVWVKLRTDRDVDTELWTANGKREIAIVAWRVGKIDSPTAASIKYAGGTIKYSGYNGIASKNGALNFGHEDIKIVGKSKSAFVMKAFAFESGTAKVYYSWGADPVKCKALKAAANVAQNCSGANSYTKAMKVALKAAIQLVEGHEIKLKKCHTNKEKYSKHLHQLDAKEKKYKEGDAKESRMKKERAIKKERAQKYAKEQKNKESKAKEGAHKVEQAAKEKHAKERNAKEQARKRELKGKEKSQKAEAAAKEKSAKERNGKERAKKREHKNKEAAAKAKERHDKAVKKERKAKADERRSKELSSKERTSKERTSKERTNKAERAKKESASKEQSQKKERASKERAKKQSASKAERSHKERSYKQERTNKERSSKQYRARNTCTVWAYEHNHFRGRLMRQHSYCGPRRQDIRFHRMYRRRRGFHASSFKLSSGCRQAQLWDEDNCRYGYGDNMNIRSSTGSVTWDLNDDICGMSIWSTAGHNC